MKKKVISGLLVLCMVFTLIPMTGQAAVPLSILNIGGTNVALPSDGNTTFSNTDIFDSTWWVSNNSGSYTLTINNLNVSTPFSWDEAYSYSFTAAIYADGDLNLVLQGTSTVNNPDALTTGMNKYAIGIYIKGFLNITGSGTLNVSSNIIAAGFCYGVYVMGNLTISENVTLDVRTLDNSNAYRNFGICCNDTVTIQNYASVSATGGDIPTITTDTMQSKGMYLRNLYVYDDAKLSSIGGSLNGSISSSMGIDLFAGTGMMHISTKAMVYVKSGSAGLRGSYGIGSSNDDSSCSLTVNDGNLTAISSSSTWSSAGISMGGTINIYGGTVISSGGGGNNSSYGIYSRRNNITINNSTIVATAGTASTNFSYAICANHSDRNISIDNNSLVVAKAEAVNASALNRDISGIISGNYNGKIAVFGDSSLYKVLAHSLDLTTGDHSAKTLADDGYAWDNSTNTLTLRNIVVNGYADGITTDTFGIKAPADTGILLEGKNVVSAGDTTGSVSHGINTTGGALTISGNGEIIALGGNSQDYSYGLYSDTFTNLNGGFGISLPGHSNSISGALNLSPSTTDADAVRTLTAGGWTERVAVWYVTNPLNTPTAVFSATGTDTGILSNVTTNMKYSVDGGSNWINITGPTMDISGVTASNDVKVYEQGNGTTTSNSSIQTINITQASSPSVTSSNCTTLSNNDGKLIGVTSVMEYRFSTATEWTSGTGSDITGLSNGVYHIHVKAEGSVLASESQIIIIHEYVGLRENTPNATADYISERLTGLDADAAYLINGDSVTSNSNGEIVISNHLFNTAISLVKVGNGITTSNSFSQTITLSARPIAPDCTVTQPSASSSTGSISGITTAMQYSTDNGATWINGDGNIVTGFVPGTVLVRLRAQAGNSPTGLSQNITITAYVPPVNTYTPPELVTVLNNGDSCIASNLDELILKRKTLTVNGDKFAKLIFDNDALKGIDEQTSGHVKFEIKDVTSDYQEKLPGKQVFTLTVSSGGKVITDFRGSVTVSLPYELKEKETADQVTVWYLASDGIMTEIPCIYNDKTRLASFTVTHFSQYVVGVNNAWENPYSDIDENNTYYDAIKFVANNNLMKGVSLTEFGPDAILTRGMIVTILYRMEKEPVTDSMILFSDIPEGMWYTNAVSWAADNNIVNGYDGKFHPNDTLTREQMTAILYRYATYKKYDVSQQADLSSYTDKPSDWALSSVSWAVEEGLLTSNDGSLNLKGNISRGQIATVLKKFVENNAR